MKIYYKDNTFIIRAFEGRPTAVLEKEGRLPTIEEQFKMLKRLRSLFPAREIDFRFEMLDNHFCIKLKPAT